VGGLLDVQPIGDVSKIENKNTFYRYFYAGNAMSKVNSAQKPNIITIRLTSFDKSPEVPDNKAESVKLDLDIDYSNIRSSKFVENMSSKTDKVELTSARVVISGGRALKSKENFKILEDLASCFDGAAIGASRAAVDAGYVPNDLQVGQTGKVVAPDLYIAIGISGAIQHVAGMKDSKVIVSINNDPESPIFNVNKIIYYNLLF
jgi:electron transfer flavoprotein alpha subunit